MAIKQTAGRDALGDFAPKFAELNDDVLFGEVWSREDKLSLRDRSLVTVTALMAQGLTDSSFKYHLESAKKNGITKEEIAEILTHAAFYAGWPKAWAAFRMAKEVWSEKTDDSAMTKHAASMVFPIGAANDGFAQYFSGKSYLAPVSKEQVGIFNVTFEPGCRNNWHIHHAKTGGGQLLICIAGRGFYQEWGKAAVELLGEARCQIFDAVAESRGFAFLAIGRPESAGCYCKVNGYLKEVIGLLAGSFDYVVIDGEAGVEQINRRVMEKVTHLLLITDASRKGTQVIQTVKKVADELVMYDQVGAIVNRLPSREVIPLLDTGDIPVLSYIENDAALADFDIRGENVFYLPESANIVWGVREALEKLSV